MSRLPSSPSRAQALAEFEPHLLDIFDRLTAQSDREVRDAMHYALFSEEDRFCISAAWLIAPRLGISPEKLANAAAAVEFLRCSLAFKTRPTSPNNSTARLIEPALAEAASYGLIPLAFEAVLFLAHPSDRAPLAAILAKAASPIHMLSALHREAKILRQGITLSRDELKRLHQEKLTPAFRATGEILETLSTKPLGQPGALASWFVKLGLFTYWLEDFSTPSLKSPLSLSAVISRPEAMDLIKSLEADLLVRARELEIAGAAHEVIEPLAEILKAQLQ